MHIALIEHMPLQTSVVNLLQKLFGSLHLAVMLQSENTLIKRGILFRQNLRDPGGPGIGRCVPRLCRG